MHKVNKKLLIILLGLCFASLVGGASVIYPANRAHLTPPGEVRLPILLAHLGSSPSLERPPVAFDHDVHTAALKQNKLEDCAVCHVLKETDKRLINPEVKIFGFPKELSGKTDKTAIMYAYHNQCIACHRKMSSEGKKTGPDLGLCGKCHTRRDSVKKIAWAWSPLFNYARHAKHVEAARRFDAPAGLNVVEKIEVIGEIPDAKKGCLLCHHIYDEGLKKLVYKKDTENSCRACHKAEDIKNARSMKKVAHSACVGCHLKLREKVKQEALGQGRTELTEQEKKSFGPFECKGCHGEHKDLSPEEIKKIPRLVRGQKDVQDLALLEQVPVDRGEPKAIGRMKVVAFNHKQHEQRGQFCNSCHHYSLEKCVNCHTLEGNPTKGGQVTFQQAFHKVDTKQSCAGCHAVAKQEKKCSGCHQEAMSALPQASCPVCHRGPSSGKPVDAPAMALVFDKEKVPEKAEMKAIEKDYKPANMPHQKIMAKLTAISNDSSLGRVFHAGMGEDTLCTGCHHKSQPGAQVEKKWPKCSECHGHPFNPLDLSKPGLQVAYHQQCMQCHEAMGHKPTPLDCEKCHAVKAPSGVILKTEIPLRGYGK
jgi:hypothetical protein